MSSTSKYDASPALVAVGTHDRAALRVREPRHVVLARASPGTPGTPSRTASPRTHAPSPCHLPESRREPSDLPCLSSRRVGRSPPPRHCHSIRRRTSTDGIRHPVRGPTTRASDGAEGARTPDLLAASQTLSQLSYGPGKDVSLAASHERPGETSSRYPASHASTSETPARPSPTDRAVRTCAVRRAGVARPLGRRRGRRGRARAAAAPDAEPDGSGSARPPDRLGRGSR